MTVSILGLCTLAVAAAQDARPELSWDRFEQVREQVLPSAEESRWLVIPWHSRLWDAVVEARRVHKPILLWAMNGHPLGCV